MRKYFIIIVSVCICLPIGLFLYSKNRTLQQSEAKPKNIQYNVTIVPDDNSYTITITGTGIYEDNILHLKQSITSFLQTQEMLRDSTSSLIYNDTNNTLENFTLNSLTGSNSLDNSYLVFIQDIITSKLQENLLPDGLSLGTKKEKSNFLTTNQERTMTREDATWIRQTTNLSVIINCGISKYFSLSKTCSIRGNLSLSTPLASGPILWKIQWNFSTSLLQ